MLEGWLPVAKALGSVISFAGTLAENKRLRVATYLDEIAKNLKDMAVSVEQGQKFGTHCIKLQTTSSKLYEICHGVTQAKDLKLLSEQLNLAAASPGRLSQREELERLTGEEREEAIEVLRESAAHFEAHASVLRAK